MDAPEVLDDFEFEEVDNLNIQDREVNKQKLRRRIEQYKVESWLFNPGFSTYKFSKLWGKKFPLVSKGLLKWVLIYILQMRILNQPRESKKLVVLDIDYTLFDHRSPAENPHELMRPCKFTEVCAILLPLSHRG